MNNSSVIDSIKKLRAETGHGVLDCKKALDKFGSFEEALEYLNKQPVKISKSDTASTVYAVVGKSAFKITSNTIQGINNDIFYKYLEDLKVDNIDSFIQSVSKHTRENLRCVFIHDVSNLNYYYHRFYKKTDNYIVVPRLFITNIELDNDDKINVLPLCLNETLDTEQIKKILKDNLVLVDRLDSINLAKSYF